jgi:hypothetical protein
MAMFEYRVIPAPRRGMKVKGARSGEARFAHALEEVMNRLGAEGWEYQRTDTLPCEERQGLTSKTTVYRNMLVFRRELAGEEALAPKLLGPPPAELPDASGAVRADSPAPPAPPADKAAAGPATAPGAPEEPLAAAARVAPPEAQTADREETAAREDAVRAAHAEAITGGDEVVDPEKAAATLRSGRARLNPVLANRIRQLGLGAAKKDFAAE